MHRRRRRSGRWVLGGALLVVFAWSALAAALLAGAAADARGAKEELEAARARFGTDELVEGEGLAALERAQEGFASAEARSGSLPLAPVGLLPVVGRQVRSLHALSGAGAEVLEVAVDAAGDVAALREGVLEAHERVTAVEELRATVAQAGDRLRSVRLGPDEALVTPLAEARATVADELTEAIESIDRASTVTTGMAEVLAGSRYLVLAANNAEMQTGWGMPLSAGVLEVVDGELRLDTMEPTADLLLPADAVPVPGDFGDRWGFMRPSQDFRNLALTADFDQAAPVAAAMWEALGRGPVGGVFVLDPVALAAILRSTGPVESGGRTVTADDVVPLVLHDAYVEQGGEPEGRDERRQEQSDIAVAAVDAATAPGTDLIDLAENLAEAAEGRHVLAWSSDPEQQAAWEAVAVDGALGPDSLLVGPANRAGNKLDWFLDVSADLSATPTPDGVEVAVEIELTNRTPDGEPRYIAGPYGDERLRDDDDQLVAEGDWRGFLTVHLPGDAGNAGIDGMPLAVDGPAGPTRVVSTVVEVPKGASASHTVRFTLPPGSDGLTVEPSARVRPISWSAGDERWKDDDGARAVPLVP